MSDSSEKSALYLRLIPSDADERAGYRFETLEEPLWGLGPLGRVNLFVGSTSSGKSRLMRSILKQAEYEYHADERHLRSSGVALSKLERLYGTDKISGPLRNMMIQLRGQYQGRPELIDGQSEFMLMPQNGYHYQLRSTNRILQSLKNLATQSGDLNQYRQFLSLRCRMIDAAITAAANATAINEYKNGTEEFKQQFSALDELRQSVTMLRDEVDRHCKSGVFSLQSLPRAKAKRIYIPVLRNPNPLQRRERLDDVFAQTVRIHYDLPHDVDILTGQELYKQMFDTRNNYDPNIRDRHTEFELFLSATFFARARVEVVPALEDEVTSLRRIKIRIGGVERELPSVGDGIQSLVILMYTLFRADPGTHIFIEEPENSLHPGLQRIMLDTMLDNKFLQSKNLRIFMTTHSNHLVDLSIRNFEDASIFVFEKYNAENSDPSNERFLIRPANNARRHAIASLEALNSSVLMANCSIWVEGVTDRLYIRAYVDAYWRSSECEEDRKKAGANTGRFLEDIHYAFFEYAGSNLAHYVFDEDAEAGRRDVTDNEIRMQFIANRVFLIADQDAKKDNKHDKWTKMAEGTDQFCYYVTKGREIENMISAELLKELLRNKFIRDVPIERIDEIQEGDYRMVGLGKYLNDKLFGGLKAHIRSDKGETLASDYKLKLAEKTRDRLQKLAGGNDHNAAWNMLSDEAKALAKQIDTFIRRHNPRVSV